MTGGTGGSPSGRRRASAPAKSACEHPPPVALVPPQTRRRANPPRRDTRAIATTTPGEPRLGRYHCPFFALCLRRALAQLLGALPLCWLSHPPARGQASRGSPAQPTRNRRHVLDGRPPAGPHTPRSNKRLPAAATAVATPATDGTARAVASRPGADRANSASAREFPSKVGAQRRGTSELPSGRPGTRFEDVSAGEAAIVAPSPDSSSDRVGV
jgi:hypothetical protein